MQFEQVAVADVLVGEGHRPVNEEAVQALMRSIAEIGLKTPISVWFLDEATMPDGMVVSCVPLLVTGRHRLEAMRRLGWAQTNAMIIDGDERDARLWEIAENLHRAELTELERAQHIADWIQLTQEKKGAQLAPPAGGRQPHDKGIKAAVRELGIERTEAQRAVKINSIPAPVKEAAVEAGLADNQSALLKVARAPDPAAELERLRGEKEEKEAARRNRGRVEDQPPPAPEPPAAAAAAAEPDSADQPSVEELLARARAAAAVHNENCRALPDPEVHGVSKTEWKRRNAEQAKARGKALAEQERCLARAAAELCRPIAADLLEVVEDGLGRGFEEEFLEALEDIVRPDRETAEESAEGRAAAMLNAAATE